MAKSEEIKLFVPTTKDLRQEYSELLSVPEFTQLTQKEMNFVWGFANKTSTFSAIKNEKDRVLKCLHYIADEISGKQVEDYSNLNFPLHISTAIERMSRFDPYLRTQAKNLTEVIFENIKKVVNQDPAEIKDMDDKKKYIALSLDVLKSMPELIRQLENGYGITEVKTKKEELVNKKETIWDRAMGDDDENS